MRSNDRDMRILKNGVLKHLRVYVVGTTILIATITYAICRLILQILNCKLDFVQNFSQRMAGLSGIIGFVAILFFLLKVSEDEIKVS